MPTSVLRPSADIVSAGWAPSTGSTLWGVLSDSPTDDSRSCVGNSGSNSPMEVALGAFGESGVTGASVRVRVQRVDGGIVPAEPVVELREGASVRASFSWSFTGTDWVEGTRTLTPAERASVVSWSSLSVRITPGWASGFLLVDHALRVSEVWLEITWSGVSPDPSHLPLLGVG